MEILKSLESCPAIEQYEFLEFRRWHDGFYYKAKIIMKDTTILFARQYVAGNQHMYSFHWQKNDEQLICRWDNAPYHPEIATAPHHKHTIRGIEESRETQLADVLKYIERPEARGERPDGNRRG